MKPAMKKVLRAALAALALPILLPVLLLVQSTAYALPPPCDPNDPDATQTITITSPANNTVFASGTTPITVNYTYTSTGVVGYTGSTWSLYTNGTLTQSGSLANTATSVSFANLGTANYGVTIAPKHGIMGEGCVVDQTSGGVSFSVASPVPPNAAQFISQSVPASMVAGQVYPVSVSMKNTGTNTWTSGSAYSLGSQNPQDNSAWGTNRVAMPASTAPGSTATFSFNVTAPAFGSYNFQWQMVQDGVAWFGDYSPNAAVAVSKANQTISFAALAGKTYGDAPFAVSASATSGLAVTFSSTTPSVCTVSGSTVTIAATGTCTIAADQAGNANYNAAPQFPQSFTVGQGTQTIAGFAPATPIAYAPGGTFALTATGGASGNAVTFASTTPAICTVSGATATIVAVGSCTLTANQAGNPSYAAAAQVTAGVAINKANQTIAFGALATRTVGDAPFALSATASSGLAVTFSSTTGTVCTVSGATATLLTAGICTVAADQAGNANYNAAAQVTQSFTVNPAPLQVFYVHPDHLGTPRAITRASDNAKVWEWKNDDPFGNNPPNEDPGNMGITFRYNLRFGGMTYFDQETGTLQNTHRDLDLLAGRYVQSDPIGLAGGISTYAYVGGSPISRIDPFGLTDLTYNDDNHTFTVTDSQGNAQTFPAANNAASTSRGPWATGQYQYGYSVPHTADMDGPYGSHGNFVFNVPGCTGCGVHSGRQNRRDAAGRSGINHATEGCIRTTDDATSLLERLQRQGDLIRTLTVVRTAPPQRAAQPQTNAQARPAAPVPTTQTTERTQR